MTKQDETETEDTTTPSAETPKPVKKLKGKGKVKATAKKAKGNGKTKKVAAKKPAKSKTPIERDQFGFRIGSKKSDAAKLYASKRGATLGEVKEKTGSSQLNLLTELKNRKIKVEQSKEKGTGKKQVTRYKIVVPEGGLKAKSAKPVKKAAKPVEVSAEDDQASA